VPELPEVETVCRGLRQTVVGKNITAVRVNAPKSTITVSRSFGRNDLATALNGRTVLGVDRRGKNILIRLSGDTTLWVHLKMTGHFFYEENDFTAEKHDLVTFELTQPSGGEKSRAYLRFNDYRRFGRIRLYRNKELLKQSGLTDLGPEPLEISKHAFIDLCRRRPRMFKPALLDQTLLAGVGNIYADESLWAARLHPKRLTTTVSPEKLAELYRHIRKILRLAIRRNGTSVDSYSNVNGEAGSFQKCLKVYAREGLPCPRCGARIVRRKIGSRSAHYCPKCQRLSKS